MNLLIVSPVSPENSMGGIERYLDNLLQFCREKECNSFFLLPSSGKKEYEKQDNLSIYRKSFLKLESDEVFGRKKVSNSQIQKKAKKFFNFLLQFLEKEKIDIVLAQGFDFLSPSFNLALHMACFTKNVLPVLQVHIFPEKEIDKAMINDLPWEKLICVSKSVAGDLYNKGANIEKLSTLYLGVNTAKFNPQVDKKWLKKVMNLPSNSRVILHASRITDGEKPILKGKGIITLLETLPKLVNNYPDLRLVIATASPPKDIQNEFLAALEQLKNYIQLYSLGDKVFTRIFKLDEMPKAYAGSDIFVLASENETFGQVFIESMACGTPVIGTNVGGVPEIIADGTNGFLIDPGDASTLSVKISELLDNKERREDFIKAGEATANSIFSAEKQFDALFNYLKSLKNSK